VYIGGGIRGLCPPIKSPEAPQVISKLKLGFSRVKGIAVHVFFIRFRPLSGGKLHIIRNA